MASRNLDDLNKSTDLKERALRVIDRCKQSSADILIYCTLRTMKEQAILYRRSRSTQEINSKILTLEELGFDYLAKILRDVGPQLGILGTHITYAGPGESWHNIGYAFDAVILDINKNAVWNYNDPRWNVYGSAAVSLGLDWGGNWPNFKDRPHCQLLSGPNPVRCFTPTFLRELLIKSGEKI